MGGYFDENATSSRKPLSSFPFKSGGLSFSFAGEHGVIASFTFPALVALRSVQITPKTSTNIKITPEDRLDRFSRNAQATNWIEVMTKTIWRVG